MKANNNKLKRINDFFLIVNLIKLSVFFIIQPFIFYTCLVSDTQ